MDYQINFTLNAACVACLSTGRILYLVNDPESKRMFAELLDNLELFTHPVSLCYECVGRLRNAVRFKTQVKEAYKFLIEYLEQKSPPPSLSKLDKSKTEIYEWEPSPIYNSQDEHMLWSHSPPKEEKAYNNLMDYESDCDISNDNTNPTDINDDTDKHFKRKNKSESQNQTNKTVNCDVNSFDLKQSESWDVKVENPLRCIKDEPDDEKCTEYSNLDIVYKSETKYEFDDSDDEPLTAKRARTKKVKKAARDEKSERPPGVVSGVWVQRKLQKLNVPPGQLEMVVLSWDEVEKERQKSLTSVTYTRHEFRCSSCVLGFNHRFKLDSHMKKHLPEAGDLECNLCKTRFKTQSAFLSHRRRHRSRWRCLQCRALFSRAAIAADHHARAHGAPPPTHACHVCQHTTTSLGKLRVHLKNHAERQHCDQCGKSFRDKSSLRTHLYIHTNQKDFSCDVCDKRFRFKKALEIHSIRHEAPELLYCRDCDKNFKNRLSFYQHINYSMKHIHPDKVKHACEFCPRRFLTPTRLEEHRHSIHLKLAPHRCTIEGCTFASASRPALRTHVRMVHKNKRLERNHVCHTCGKAYTTKKILEGHIRSHTGERPFVCAKCPATFSHDAALYNHNKLVHKTPFVRRRKSDAPTSLVPSD